VIVIIGCILILYGLIKLVQGMLLLLKALIVPFWSEKKMDKELFKQWEDENDYKEFESKIDDL
tara:strand:- start:127 stop:315 length:189 start_codon:yes stop_codon:yes gene_type:complete